MGVQRVELIAFTHLASCSSFHGRIVVRKERLPLCLDFSSLKTCKQIKNPLVSASVNPQISIFRWKVPLRWTLADVVTTSFRPDFSSANSTPPFNQSHIIAKGLGRNGRDAAMEGDRGLRI